MKFIKKMDCGGSRESRVQGLENIGVSRAGFRSLENNGGVERAGFRSLENIGGSRAGFRSLENIGGSRAGFRVYTTLGGVEQGLGFTKHWVSRAGFRV